MIYIFSQPLCDSGEDRPFFSKGAARAAIHNNLRAERPVNLKNSFRPLRVSEHNLSTQPAAPAAAPSPFREYSQIPQMTP